MKQLILTCALCLVFPAPGPAKVLLDSAEKTYARECLDYAADGTDLISICQTALSEGQFGQVQHIKILRALGDAYRWTDQMKEAEHTYRSILDVNAASADAMNGLGWVAYDQSDYATAAAFFKDSIAINPTNDGLSGYAGAGFRADLLSTDAAMEFFDAALTLKPKDRWTLREKGWVLYNSHRYSAALTPFQAAIDINPEDSNAHKGMAKALAELERYEEALDHINTAADLDPDNLDNLIWRSHISRWNGHNLRALKDANLVIEESPGQADGYVLKARAEGAMGFDQLAITTLRTASGDLPESQFLRYWLANFLKDDDQPQEAFALMERVLRDGDPDGYDYKLYAALALDLNKLVQARTAIDTGRAMAPFLQEFGFLESRLLVLEGQFDRAEQVFATAIQDGLSTSYVKQLARLLIKQGEMQRAIAVRARFGS